MVNFIARKVLIQKKLISDPLETRKVRILDVGWLDLYQSRGAVGHPLPDIVLLSFFFISFEPRVE